MGWSCRMATHKLEVKKEINEQTNSMRSTDYIIVNMLKNQLLDVYTTFENRPELLKDPLVDDAFFVLNAARTVKEFRQWIDTVEKSDLSIVSIDGMGRKHNVIGILSDTATGASDEALGEFISWRQGINSLNCRERIRRDFKEVRRVKEAVKGNYDAHIVLFKCGSQWAAIGGGRRPSLRAFRLADRIRGRGLRRSNQLVVRNRGWHGSLEGLPLHHQGT